MKSKKRLIIVGGGAAGIFAAIEVAKNQPQLEIIVLEQGNEVLEKVKISGGGRCNVTNACFEPKELIKYYPRGSKELLSPFFVFNCEHTVEWFTQKGVTLKTEEDGRIFPISNRSQTIIDCLLEQARLHHVQIIKQTKVTHLSYSTHFIINTTTTQFTADYLLITSGNNATIWKLLKQLGHHIIAGVPSLFTFNIKSELLKNLEGISFPNATCSLLNSKINTNGAILITHVGLSGPAILKLSAFAARDLNERNYQFDIQINWLNEKIDAVIHQLKEEKNKQAKKQLQNFFFKEIPHRFWLKVLDINGIAPIKLVADLSKNDMQNIAQTLTQSTFQVTSKNSNKDEFVTAGGVDLREVDFKTMQSKIIPSLYFAGEVLNMDAVTGGFNFQAAWTTAYIAGNNIGK